MAKTEKEKETASMQPLTGRERIANILKRQPVDRIGVFEHFWSDTQRTWTEQGHLQPFESLEDLCERRVSRHL